VQTYDTATCTSPLKAVKTEHVNSQKT